MIVTLSFATLLAPAGTTFPGTMGSKTSTANLSRRGNHNATFVRENLQGVLELLRNQYDPVVSGSGPDSIACPSHLNLLVRQTRMER